MLRYSKIQAIFITAVLFGLFHGNKRQILYTSAGGIMFGIVAVLSDSVIPAIYLHILANVFEGKLIPLFHMFTYNKLFPDITAFTTL